MKFKIYFNDNNSVEVLDEELQKISVNELLQKLKNSDYNEDHEIVFCTPDNNKIHLEVKCFDDIVNNNLYQISLETIFDNKNKLNQYLEMNFKTTNVRYDIGSIYNVRSYVRNYDVFSNEMYNLIDEWCKKSVNNFSRKNEFRNVFNAILKIEIQRAIEYRTINFTRIKEYLQVCKEVLIYQKLEIDQKIDSYSILLSVLDNESKRNNLKK